MAFEEIYRGSKASDFQPTTRDPQSDVGGGLQPNAGTLQPESGVSQQSLLPNNTDLKVQTVAGSTQTSTTPLVRNEGVNGGWFWLAFALVLIAALVWWVIKNRGTLDTSQLADPVEEETKAAPSSKPQASSAKKPASKSKPTKKKKSKSTKRRRK